MNSYQVWSAIYSYEGRTENGATHKQAWQWLVEELAEISQGVEVYEPQEEVQK